MKFEVEKVKYDGRGLVPAVVQDAATKEVLTLAYMNAESLRRTVSEGETWFWSRSRRELWHKGATSGNVQRVTELKLDCDGDALLLLVEPAGPACHTGARSCFDPEAVSAGPEAGNQRPEIIGPDPRLKDEDDLGSTLERLYRLIETRREERPEGSYTTYLFNQGLDKILKKVGEESAETIIAAKNEESGPLVSEVSDLLYHLVVLLVERGVPLDEVRAELARRAAGGGGNQS